MFNRIVAITAITIGLTISVFGQSSKSQSNLKGEAGRAMSHFQGIGNFDDYLRRIRLPAVSASHKEEVLESLSSFKEAHISDRNRIKLNSILPILRFHQRDNVVSIKVVQYNHAIVKLRSRAVLLISDKALNILSMEELQATVAHEMAHDYFWREYFAANDSRQYHTLREIELLCDGVAIITMDYLRIDARNLISGVERMNSFNARIVSIDHRYHPSIGDRVKFKNAMSELVRGRNATRSALVRK